MDPVTAITYNPYQNVGQSLGNLVFGNSDQPSLGSLLSGKPYNGTTYLKTLAVGAQAQNAMQQARDNRAKALIDEQRVTERANGPAAIQGFFPDPKQAAMARLLLLGNETMNMQSLGDLANPNAGAALGQAAIDMNAARSTGDFRKYNQDIALASGKSYEPVTMSDSTMIPSGLSLGDEAFSALPTPLAQSAIAKNQATAQGGGIKGSDFQIVQGADGTQYRVNKLTGNATPLTDPSGAHVTGVNEFKMRQLQMQAPKAAAALQASNSQLNRLEQAATQLLGSRGVEGITGWRGAIPNFPGSDASNAKAELDTLKSQIGFNVLQQMRDMSKTGGALGQISDKEEELLQNNLAALQTSQSPEQFRANLQRIIDYAEDAKRRLGDAYSNEYEIGAAGTAGNGSMPAPGASPAGGPRVQFNFAPGTPESVINAAKAAAALDGAVAAPAVPAAASGPTAVNPRTGERVQWNGAQWVPVGGPGGR
jgi:hypothetical protein